MKKIRYYLIKILSKFSKDKNEFINNYYRKIGMNIGNNTHIFSNLISSEPYLISIGSDSTVSVDVSFLTHDASIGVIKGRNIASDICGEIKIGNHCFIGKGSIILYGVSLEDYTIVAAGSVVTKSFDTGNIIIGGNPARVIGTVDNFIKKNKDNMINLHGLSLNERKKEILKNQGTKVVKNR